MLSRVKYRLEKIICSFMFGNSELSYLNAGVLVCYVRENLGSPAMLTVIKLKINVQCDP